VPDGSTILYTVGDQLRRTSLPTINPITVVTTGYSQPIGFSSRYHFALYSTQVVYGTSTKRDLRVTTTDAFNPNPTALVSQPVAVLPRSYMTSDEKFVLYLTDVTPTGANLHAVTVDGAERAAFRGVVEAAATDQGSIVFTDNASDPTRYPVVADLRRIDLNAAGNAPELLAAKTVDGKSFQVDASGTYVVYVGAAIDADAGARTGGLFVQSLD
jgi:hypothetical protein